MEEIQRSRKRKTFLAILLILSAALVFAALILPLVTQLLTPSLQVGQVASQDILAPEAITYPSEVLTEQRREAAARAVSPVYTRSDTSVARQQLEQLRAAMAYITSVRSDSFSSSSQKLNDLTALKEVQLSPESANTLLALSDSRWQAVQQEAFRVLEEVMRGTIRPDRLQEVRSNVPSSVSLFMPEDQAILVSELVVPFVSPNSDYSESLTEAARQAARDAVEPITTSYMAGERVVQRGQVLSEADIEALQQFGLAQPEPKWQDPVSAAGLALLFMVFIFLYLQRRPTLSQNLRNLTVLTVLFLLFLFLARLAIYNDGFIPYIFPLAAYGLIVAAMFGQELGLVTALPLAVLTAYGLPNSLELTIFYSMTGLLGILALGRAWRMTSFFWAGGAIALSGAAVILIYRLPLPNQDYIDLATLASTALFNGLASASLAVVIQYFLAQFLGMVTPMQLMEMIRPDHALLQMILREAPGTYQHSLQVANLAEQAAERVGADTLLTRVGALYHDAGKAMNPVFFIENQVAGHLNPHDDLDPLTSSAIIIRHVRDGLELARKHRLSERVMDFISEHHGTMMTRYQYVKAVEAANGDEDSVDKEQFRYPGPRPQSRETAILMLADGVEARMRAEHPSTEEEIYMIVKSTVDTRVSVGQLDDTDLTLKDLDVIIQSFVRTLRGVYHPRVKYPKLEQAKQPKPNVAADTVPISPKTSDVPLGSPADPSTPAP